MIAFQIGNALIDDLDEAIGYFNYVWSHALLSDEIYEGIMENCNFSSAGNLSDTCISYEEQLGDAEGNFFPYNIYAPWCSSSSNSSSVNLHPSLSIYPRYI